MYSVAPIIGGILLKDNKMRYLLSLCLLSLCCSAEAQDLGFSCEAKGGPPENYIWRYSFEIDQKTSKGVQNGVNFGGKAYSEDIEVVFTPARMQIKDLGATKFTGYIDRKTLAFNFGGAVGSCKMVPVKKPDSKF